MTSLVIGLILFLGIHLLPALQPAKRENLVEKLGAGVWKGLFSLVSVIGL